MHAIKFRGCVAQQDNKTLDIFISKNGVSEVTYKCDKRLSGKELRTIIAKYLTHNVG